MLADSSTRSYLNSVIQYFPDLDYLMTVLEGAVESVRPGGAVFVGDVRSLPSAGSVSRLGIESSRRKATHMRDELRAARTERNSARRRTADRS